MKKYLGIILTIIIVAAIVYLVYSLITNRKNSVEANTNYSSETIDQIEDPIDYDYYRTRLVTPYNY